MLSGLERQREVLCRQRSVAWAWIKARGVMNRQPTPSHAKLTTSVLLSNDSDVVGQAASWRANLTAVTYRELARQICDQFYDLSIFSAWRSRTVEPAATSRMLSPALPSYCRQETAQPVQDTPKESAKSARILESVLADRTRKGAVLIPLRSRAA